MKKVQEEDKEQMRPEFFKPFCPPFQFPNQQFKMPPPPPFGHGPFNPFMAPPFPRS